MAKHLFSHLHGERHPISADELDVTLDACGTGPVARAVEVWTEWHALPDGELWPIKTIAARLGMATIDVARIVYPPTEFGEARKAADASH